jgi:hypothetical protein
MREAHLQITRKCLRCHHPISLPNRIAAVYDFGINCNECGCRMEISGLVLFFNMFLCQLAGYLMMASLRVERGPAFYILLEIWALFVFLPLISIVVVGVKRG